MELEPQITFRNIDPSPAIEDNIRQHLAKLDRFHSHITHCRVTVEVPHRHHHKGQLFDVRVDLTVPGGELLVNRAHAKDHSHEDVYVAIRDAFHAARRQLENFARRRRGEVKTHDAQPQGQVANLFADENYGFIETPDGREVYFHANSVIDGGFAQLAVGNKVEFVEVMGEKGPQATTVRLIGRHEKPSQ